MPDFARAVGPLGRRARRLTALALGVARPHGRHRGAPGADAAPLPDERLAGQRVIYSYSGLAPPPELLQRTRDGQAAGVIFFSDNIDNAAQIASVIDELRQAQRESDVRFPLPLMTDQEGGPVRRLPGQPVISEKVVGQAPQPDVVAVRQAPRPAATSRPSA